MGIVEENIEYAVNNNLRIAINICKLGIKYKVTNNLLVSTDKAVKPKILWVLVNIYAKKFTKYIHFIR